MSCYIALYNHHEVETEKLINYLNRYYLLLTPNTKKIREIWAMSSYISKSECLINMDVINIPLEEIYGKFIELYFSQNITKYIDVAERRVSIRCSGFMEFNLYLRYTDYGLDKLLRNELAEEDYNNNDTADL